MKEIGNNWCIRSVHRFSLNSAIRRFLSLFNVHNGLQERAKFRGFRVAGLSRCKILLERRESGDKEKNNRGGKEDIRLIRLNCEIMVAESYIQIYIFFIIRVKLSSYEINIIE